MPVKVNRRGGIVRDRDPQLKLSADLVLFGVDDLEQREVHLILVSRGDLEYPIWSFLSIRLVRVIVAVPSASGKMCSPSEASWYRKDLLSDALCEMFP